MLTQEQTLADRRAGLDVYFGLTRTLVEGTGKLVELNVQWIRSTLAESREHAHKALSAQGPQDWLALQTSLAAPMAEKAQTYSRQLSGIVSATQAELAQVANAQCGACCERVQTLVDEVARSSLAGSEAAIAAWKYAISTTSTLLDSLQKTGQQVVRVTESNLATATAAGSKNARRTIEQASQTVKR
ncbi:TIGR01841 family phasin [Paraburkholderia dilworthii]|uniref:TIGR01841 family phasin n=1 Tax=Paraburkholderia dilworthii TaxID=948106 RepID=UPI0003FC96EE|nr:TIGR01841 family phasin [Paraburkholderia dilworthii]